MAAKRWFDDWELSLTGWDNGLARIDVALPHNDVTVVQFWTTKETMQGQANLIDKLLSELTGTKGAKLDGNNTPRIDR
jgi:hypothetical protein